VVSIVEEPAVPELVAALGAFVEVLVVGAVEEVQPVEDVLRCVRVYDVEQDREAEAVGSIDQFFQVLWCAVTRACSEKARDLVAKSCQSR
jgi:hypothetical protein